MKKTKIEWTRGPNGEPGYTWNPIKGLCPEGCWYCYARAIYKRFKLDPKPWLDISELNMTAESRITGKRIFVCSTFELFNPITMGMNGFYVRGEAFPARDMIFDVITRRADNTYIILTKRPERIDRPMPPNVWLGVSVTEPKDLWRLEALRKAQASIKFVSFEPILIDFWPRLNLSGIDWAIIGRLTGRGHREDPPNETISWLLEDIHGQGIPVFLKNNLKDIWKGKLVQEYPEVKP